MTDEAKPVPDLETVVVSFRLPRALRAALFRIAARRGESVGQLLLPHVEELAAREQVEEGR